MDDLCDDWDITLTDHPTIPGLLFAKGAVPKEYHDVLVNSIRRENWFNLNDTQATAETGCSSSQFMAFGRLQVYRPWLLPLLSASEYILELSDAKRRSDDTGNRFDQMIANYYMPGDGLKAHIDLPHKFDDGIIVVSLLGSVEMQFTFSGQDGENDVPTVAVYLEPGDLVCLSGEARWKWMHGIASRSSDFVNGRERPRSERMSITLRKLLPDVVS
ncbi:hypothetical protein BJ742DRAFT_776721 [Cladochytrium replicatum]|nr:hypothetical protein BJ742DRAFT_776721 [Cladochytrium replicatum]